MRNYPSDVSLSENCIDVNLEMAERGDPDNFPHFPPQEWCAWVLQFVLYCFQIRSVVLNSKNISIISHCMV